MGRDILFDDEFEERAEEYRERSVPERSALDPRTAWERLSAGKTLGKRIGIAVFDNGTNQEETAGLNMFEVRGPDDSVAIPMTIILSPVRLRAYSGSGTTTFPVPNITGTQDNQVQSNIGTFMNAFAIVEWGIGGILNRAEVDIHNGAQLTISASFVRISGAIDNPPADQGSQDFEMAAVIAPGADKGLGGQRTIMTPTTVPAVDVETTALCVPAFARRVRVCGVTTAKNAGFTGSIIFYRSFSLTGLVAEYVFATNTSDSFFVPNGAYYFTLVPRVANVETMQAVFDLAI